MPSSSISIAASFARRRAEGRGVLIPYVTAGFPDEATTLALMDVLTEEGADVIELGVPFSDPLADGPTIQASSFRALSGGMTVRGVLRILQDFRARQTTPVVLFSYLNPVLRYGVASFLKDATAAGAQGLLLTDLPSGADREIEDQILSSELDLIRLVAPTTPMERIPEAARGGRGFLYYISRTGVTGARQEVREELGREVEAIRREVDLPVAVGFGISTPSQAAIVAGLADGVVVGSALMKVLETGGVERARVFLRELRAAIDR